MKRSDTKMKKCYWCGGPATSEDHIPPKSFFPPSKNLNLRKIPACSKHNELFSQLDERFKFYIQAAAQSPDALRQFEQKTFRGLQKEEAKRFTASLAKYSKWVTINGERRLVFSVEPAKQNNYFEKLVRGSYFLAYGEPALGSVTTASPQFLVPGLNYDSLLVSLNPVLSDLTVTLEYSSPNPDIFRFRYARDGTPPLSATVIDIVLYESVRIIGLITPRAAVTS